MRQVLFTIPIFGGIKVFGYGAMLVLAFIGSTWLATWRARREKLDPEVILDMAFWIFFIGLAGARLFYCIQYWGKGIDSLLDVVQYWKGGIVYYGGILGGVLAFFVYRHLRPFPLRPYLDVMAPPIMVGHPVRPARLLPQRLLLRRCLQPPVGGLVPQALAPLGPPVHARPDPSRRRPIRSPSTRPRSTRPSTPWSSSSSSRPITRSAAATARSWACS